AGVGPGQYTLTAIDKTPPQVPSGLDLLSTDVGAVLTWEANTETDLAGYRVFRSERGDSDFKLVGDRLVVTNKFVDATYHSGVSYRVSAVDESENESPRSASFRGP